MICKNSIYATVVNQVVCAICVAFYIKVCGGNPYVLVYVPLLLLAWACVQVLSYLTRLMVK